MEKGYVNLVRLLIEAAPAVFEGSHFAMKGGTAINLFVADMPRLSVDIDLVFADHRVGRNEALQSIADALASMRRALARQGIEAEVVASKSGEESKLFIRRDLNLVKVEANHVFRGTVLPVEVRTLVPEARALFATGMSVKTLAVPELYGSKLVAAMDRQHSRDLFDVLGLYASFGLTPEIVDCFVCYLAGHNPDLSLYLLLLRVPLSTPKASRNPPRRRFHPRPRLQLRPRRPRQKKPPPKNFRQ